MKRNALLIGAFVLAGLALIVTGVLWLNGNSLFKKQLEAMIYYQGNASGLYVGAPVTFRGVSVGQVEEIGILVDRNSLKSLACAPGWWRRASSQGRSRWSSTSCRTRRPR